jgi:GNAT superfamily N-acetyltransferase
MLDPVVLENPVVRLESLHPDHESELAHAVADGELWSLWYTAVPPPAAMNIWALFVHPDHEKCGFGRVLHDAMLAWLRARGQTTAWLTTEANSRAERFYRAAGWDAVGVAPNGEPRFERALQRQAAAR